MYPRISDLTRDLFGFELPIPLHSFGLLVALAIVAAAALAKRELDRMYAAGEVGPVRLPVTDAKGRSRVELASPSALVWTMATLAGVFGVIGSKLFHIIDYWDEFVANPARLLFSASGLTFYGGLICAGAAILYYAHKRGIKLGRLMDATAPGLILAYGIGRIGCYLSGDGDWGVCSSLANKPSWIPGFLWSETFPRAYVGMDPVTFNAQVRGEVCTLANPTGVYPTMLYEFAVCAALAGVLWLLRKHPFRAGWLFSLYAVFTGAERFAIEFIRVNPEVAFGLSQSQLISVALMLAGLVGLALLTRRVTAPPTARPAMAATA
ncbi:prolipoprotein diacylglyceryl transferase [Rubrivirga sp. S365]|uniref:Phosphatidylglycerol--prolipoprotein diacylglyceryl transferase n=1 Tax=Rubrivirga litoralis TaxID=3075598 RepID=A0ABU3BU17_9BACT|nr:MULTISPECIES: prolipoprotein diacylglyceryl transferase family protein [unclassified Rubrivirga]MDT0632735.1 prolipoprotein diacylglyceryl transferase [Rubrivirga sp. F394]MDT7856960.1 prolipoprotein diacylglyceryl transferase [Rubrivirga sp. S365]